VLAGLLNQTQTTKNTRNPTLSQSNEPMRNFPQINNSQEMMNMLLSKNSNVGMGQRTNQTSNTFEHFLMSAEMTQSTSTEFQMQGP